MKEVGGTPGGDIMPSVIIDLQAIVMPASGMGTLVPLSATSGIDSTWSLLEERGRINLLIQVSQ